MEQCAPTLTYDAKTQKLLCTGTWTILSLTPSIQQQLLTLQKQPLRELDTTHIDLLDTAGAQLLLPLLRHPKIETTLTNEHQKLFALIQKYPSSTKNTAAINAPGYLYTLGKTTYEGCRHLLTYLSFVGEFFCLLLGWLKKPQKILWRNIAKVVETTGCGGLAILGLLSFLIGIVLAYQVGIQLQNYGANIFIVNLLGLSILREFAPLITAIILAGRTGAAFTAELGTMKVNQELDALTTMGVNPKEYLVLPKIIGLIFTLPLLSMWSAFAALFGGMLMAKSMLNIPFDVFWNQFQEVIAVKQLALGLMKTPVFAFIIASIGCFQGLQVEGGAESVGQHTTRSVVESLFLIIVADAIFSILMSIFHA